MAGRDFAKRGIFPPGHHRTVDGRLCGSDLCRTLPREDAGLCFDRLCPSAKAVYHRFGNLAFKADGAGVPVFPLEAAAQMGERRGLHHGVWPRADAGDDGGLQLGSKALCGPFRAWLSDAGTGLRGGSALSVGVSGTADMRRAGPCGFLHSLQQGLAQKHRPAACVARKCGP